VPGTDHASIATEAKVVGKLAAEGIKKTDLTRDEFLGHAWDWTHKHGGIILEQLKKLAQEGIQKTDLTREAFLEHAWEWTHKHGGIILEQLKRLGASCDWDRTLFTMDDKGSHIRLFAKEQEV
jgi:valyl-tRNA synthetase